MSGLVSGITVGESISVGDGARVIGAGASTSLEVSSGRDPSVASKRRRFCSSVSGGWRVSTDISVYG